MISSGIDRMFGLSLVKDPVFSSEAIVEQRKGDRCDKIKRPVAKFAENPEGLSAKESPVGGLNEDESSVNSKKAEDEGNWRPN